VDNVSYNRAAPFFDVADPAFSVASAEVRQARKAGWYARTSYGLAVLRYDQVSRLIRHPALRQGRRDPHDDLVTCLVMSLADEGGLTTTELRDSLVLLIFGGFDTTRNQLGLAMQVFMDHPDQWRLLGEHPELGAAAVEEVMRVRPTTTWVTREALADFTFDGLDIKAGTTIHLFCESAGTDAAQAGGVEFDISAAGRAPHFGFGGGVHYCLGHYVARADMSMALTVLAGRLSQPRPAGTAVWLPDSGNTGPARLPVAFTRPARSAR
jgi:cytochrome P450